MLATLTPVVEEYYFERHPKEWYAEGLKPVLERYTAAARRVAEQTKRPLVDLTDLDPTVHIRTPENSGLRDGVHPTPTGCAEIARRYADVLEPLLKE